MRDFLVNHEHVAYMLGWHLALLPAFLSGYSLGHYRPPRGGSRKT